MKPQKGYYSLIQFCPNASRMEAVNVGIVLFSPEHDFLKSRMSTNNDRAASLVGRSQLDKKSLSAAKESLERRFEIDRNSFQSIEDLEWFINSRGNVLQLTAVRAVKVREPEIDLENLYHELVENENQNL